MILSPTGLVLGLAAGGCVGIQLTALAVTGEAFKYPS